MGFWHNVYLINKCLCMALMKGKARTSVECLLMNLVYTYICCCIVQNPPHLCVREVAGHGYHSHVVNSVIL